MADAISCYHCNNLVPDNVNLTIQVGNDSCPVCCLGCQAVARLILDNGFDQFYKFRTGNLNIPKQPDPEEDEVLSLFDQSSVLKKYAQVCQPPSATQTLQGVDKKAFQPAYPSGFNKTPVAPGASSRVTPDNTPSSCMRIDLAIDGITCAACVWLIEQSVKQQPGVAEFWINLSTHRAELIWYQSLTPLSQSLKTIQKLGFNASPFSADDEEQHLNAQQKASLIRLGVAGIGMMQNMMFAAPMYFGIVVDTEQYITLFRYVSLLVACPVVFYAAKPFFTATLRDVRTRHLTMDVPVSLAIGGAFIASAWVTLFGGQEVYFDSVCMFTFFLLLGRHLESRARSHNARSNARIRSRGNSFVRRVNPEDLKSDQSSAGNPGTGNPVKSSPQQSTPAQGLPQPGATVPGVLIPGDELDQGDFIEIKPGSLIPVDGVIKQGSTQVNEAALTGEFLPSLRKEGDKVLSGSVNIDNRIVIEVTAVGKDSHLSTINHLVDRALSERPRIASLADRVASYFVAGVLVIATVVAMCWWQISPEHAFTVTLSVLVVTCPCALSLATPTALTVATNALRENGFIITRGQVLETLAKIKHFVFDKTGTLSKGELSIETLENRSNLSDADLTALSAALEADSHHPIAKVFKPFTRFTAKNISHVSGFGVEGEIDGVSYRLGRPDFAQDTLDNITDSDNKERQQDEAIAAQVANNEMVNHSTVANALSQIDSRQKVYLSQNKNLIAVFYLSDSLRVSAKPMVKHLKQRGKRISILSGDTSDMVQYTAQILGISRYFNALSPQQKLEKVKYWQQQGDSVAMVGDGINDVPVMAGAHLSIAMNNASDLTRLKADAMLLNGNLETLSFACEKARKTYRIIKQNIGWSIGYNLTALPLAALGYIPPYAAAIGMSASSLLVVLNAMRLSRGPKTNAGSDS